MTLLQKIQLAIQVLEQVKALKVALGFDESASIADIIAQVKENADSLDKAVGKAP